MREADPDLIRRLDIRAALATETSAPRRDLLPVQIGDLAAQAKLDEVAAIITTRAREGRVGVEPPPVIAASKWRHGRRPVAAMALPERVLYRASTSLLNDGLAKDREDGDYSTFLNAPVENGDSFIVKTDLANYYSSIHLDRLASVLLSRTGEWSTITWLHGFLNAISPDVGGLPQGNYASDRLADTYADSLLRKLRRRGLTAWRYSDDFRFGASTYQNAINALEIFDEEVRAMGLYVNERKTYVLSREQYTSGQEKEATFFTEAWRIKREELTVVDLYSEMLIEPEASDVFAAVAMEELQAWANETTAARENDEKSIPTKLDLGLVLALLTAAKEGGALEHVGDLLLMEPQFAYRVANYLYTMSEADSDGVDAAVLQTLRTTALGKWKAIWLCNALSNPARERLDPWGSSLDPEIADWLRRQAGSNDEILASHAVWSLAVNELLTKEIWASLNISSGSYSRQYSAGALGKLAVADKNSLDSGDEFDRIVRMWAEQL